MGKANKKRYGFALILIVGILAVLMLIGISFAVSMRLEQNTAASYSNTIKARYLAEAGINRAIAELKIDAKTNFVYNHTTNNYLDDTLFNNCGSYSVDVEDEQRRININDTNSNLALILAGLPTIDDETEAQAIIDYRNGLPGGKFETTQQISQTNEDSDVDIDYEQLKDYITIYSYQDPNTINNTGADEPRYPINVNTASQEVIEAVLRGISDTIGGTTYAISNTEAPKVANDIIAKRPFSSWSAFEDCLNGSKDDGDLSDDEDVVLIMKNCNPNRQKPSTYTTDFCFFSGGKYTLVSTGTIKDADGDTLAEKKLKAIVDIYSILNQTKKSQFQGADGDTTPVAFKTATYDSCPVESIDSTHNWSGTGSEDYPLSGDYKIVKNAIKNGFWDNFDDTGSDDLFCVDGVWHEADALNVNRLSYLWIAFTDRNDITDEDGDGDEELVFLPPWNNTSPITLLGPHISVSPPSNDLIWDNFTWRSTGSDGISVYQKEFNYHTPPAPQAGAVPGEKWCPLKECQPNRDFQIWFTMNYYSRYHGYKSDIGNLGYQDACWIKQDYVYMWDGYECWECGNEQATNRGSFEVKFGNWDAPDYWWNLCQKADNWYYVTNTFIISEVEPDEHYFYAYEPGNAPNFHLYHHCSGVNSHDNQGQVGWQAYGAIPVGGKRSSTADNVRIIPESGAYFESESLPDTTFDSNVEWGIISGTVTLSEGANADAEKVYFQTKTPTDSDWVPSSPGVESGGCITSSNNTSIQYKANFISYDNLSSGLGTEKYFSETIALEDVFITYLPPTKILYWTNSCF